MSRVPAARERTCYRTQRVGVATVQEPVSENPVLRSLEARHANTSDGADRGSAYEVFRGGAAALALRAVAHILRQISRALG